MRTAGRIRANLRRLVVAQAQDSSNGDEVADRRRRRREGDAAGRTYEPVRVPERSVGPDASAPLGPPWLRTRRPRRWRLSGAAELFHQLNNQLGIILANAELLELKARDETSRARAAQVVSSVLEALATARTLRAAHG